MRPLNLPAWLAVLMALFMACVPAMAQNSSSKGGQRDYSLGDIITLEEDISLRICARNSTTNCQYFVVNHEAEDDGQTCRTDTPAEVLDFADFLESMEGLVRISYQLLPCDGRQQTESGQDRTMLCIAFNENGNVRYWDICADAVWGYGSWYENFITDVMPGGMDEEPDDNGDIVIPNSIITAVDFRDLFPMGFEGRATLGYEPPLTLCSGGDDDGTPIECTGVYGFAGYDCKAFEQTDTADNFRHLQEVVHGDGDGIIQYHMFECEKAEYFDFVLAPSDTPPVMFCVLVGNKEVDTWPDWDTCAVVTLDLMQN